MTLALLAQVLQVLLQDATDLAPLFIRNANSQEIESIVVTSTALAAPLIAKLGVNPADVQTAPVAAAAPPKPADATAVPAMPATPAGAAAPASASAAPAPPPHKKRFL